MMKLKMQVTNPSDHAAVDQHVFAQMRRRSVHRYRIDDPARQVGQRHVAQ